MQNQKKYIFEHGVDHTIYRLLENGYEVIPISGKACYLENWTKIDITEDLITEWLVEGYPVKQKDGSYKQVRMTGVGIRCGKVAGVDLDITDADVCTLIQTWLDDHWGKAPIRVGRAPKALAAYYQPEPQRKMRVCFTDADGNDQAIEILGVGQQFVADGRHPKTGKHYRWVRDNLVDTAVFELPEAGDYNELLAEFTKVAGQRGWRPKGRPMLGGAAGNPEDVLLNMSNPVGMTLYEVEQLLRKIEPADDYDTWYRVAMMIHTETDGSEEGYALLDRWSGLGSGYDPESNRKLWEGLKPRSLNGRGLYKLAGESFDLPELFLPGNNNQTINNCALALGKLLAATGKFYVRNNNLYEVSL